MIDCLHKQRKIALKVHLLAATSSIKFSSYFTVLWKSKDSPLSLQTSKSEVKNGQTTFDQTLTLEASVPFDQVSKKYLKYQTQMNLRLISKARQQQQPKLVGKINLQISNILNHPQKQGVRLQYPLQFCSVNAVLSLSFEVVHLLKNQQKNLYKINNGTPPKSPPTSVSIKNNKGQQEAQNEKKSEKVSLSTLMRSNIIKQKMVQTQKQSVSICQQSKIQEELKEVKKLNLQLTCQKSILQRNLSQSFQNLKYFENELDLSRKQNQRLREQLRKKLDQNVKFQLQISEVRELNTQKSFQIAASNRESSKLLLLNQQLERAQSEKKQWLVKVKDLQKLCLQIKTQKMNLQLQVRKLKNEIANLNSQLQSSHLTIQSLQETHNKSSRSQQLLASKIQQQRSFRNSLQERVKVLQTQINFLQQKLRSFKDIRLVRQQQISQIETLNLQREERIIEFESILLQSEQQLKKLRETKDRLQFQIAQKQNEQSQAIFQKNLEVEKANTKFLEIEQSFQQLKLQKESTQEELHLFLSEKQHQLMLSQNENITLKQQLIFLQETKIHFNEDIQTFKSKIAELQEILIINNEIKYKQLEKLESRNKQNERKMHEIEQQHKSLQHSYKSIQERHLVYQKEINQRQSLIERLQEGLTKQMKINQDKNNKLIQALQKTQYTSQKVAEFSRELTALNELICLLEVNESKYKNKIGDLELQLYQLRTAQQCLLCKYKEIEIQYKNNCLQDSATINQIQVKLDLQRNTSKESKNCIQNLELNLKTAFTQLHELQTQKNELLQYLRSIETTTQEQKRLRITQSEQKIRQNQKLHLQLDQLNYKQKQKEVQLYQKDKQLLKISEEIASKKIQLFTAARAREQLEAKISWVETQKIDLIKDICSINQQTVKISNQLQKEKMKCEELQELLKITHNQKQAEIEQSHKNHLQNIQRQKQEISNYKKQLQSQSTQIQNLKTTINVLQVQVQNLNLQILKKQNQITCGLSKQKDENMEYKYQSLQNILLQKEQQIAQLQEEIDMISGEANQVYDLMQQIQAYKQELQLHEEERTNFQNTENHRKVQIAELREQNCKLKEQIVTLTQKLNELEVNLYLLENSRQERIEIYCGLQKMQKASSQLAESQVEDLRIEIADLGLRIKDLEQKNGTLLAELEDKEEKHVVDLIDQHIRLSKPEFSDYNLARSNSRICKEALPDFVQTCQALMQILKNRQSLNFIIDKDGKSVSKAHIEDIPRYSRTVSLELQKMKAQLLKGDKRSNVSQLFKSCENSIKQLCAFVEECCSYQ